MKEKGRRACGLRDFREKFLKLISHRGDAVRSQADAALGVHQNGFKKKKKKKEEKEKYRVWVREELCSHSAGETVSLVPPLWKTAWQCVHSCVYQKARTRRFTAVPCIAPNWKLPTCSRWLQG